MSEASETPGGHTPEPWALMGDDFRRNERRYVGYEVGNLSLPRRVCVVSTLDGTDMGTAVANANRIVDCVNGCEGIPGPALRDGVVSDMLALAEYVAERTGADADGHAERAVRDIRRRAEAVTQKLNEGRRAESGDQSPASEFAVYYYFGCCRPISPEDFSVAYFDSDEEAAAFARGVSSSPNALVARSLAEVLNAVNIPTGVDDPGWDDEDPGVIDGVVGGWDDEYQGVADEAVPPGSADVSRTGFA